MILRKYNSTPCHDFLLETRKNLLTPYFEKMEVREELLLHLMINDGCTESLPLQGVLSCLVESTLGKPHSPCRNLAQNKRKWKKNWLES